MRFAGFLGLLSLLCLVFYVVATVLISYRGLGDPFYLVGLNLVLGVIFLIAFIVKGGLELFGDWSIRRAAGFGGGVALYSSIFFGLLLVCNLLVYRYNPYIYDSTQQKIHTLAPETRVLLEGLEEPMVIRAFYQGGKISDIKLKDLLQRMARYSGNISLEVYDTIKYPTLFEKYGFSEDKTIQLAFVDEANTRKATVVGSVDEQSLANALKKLSRSKEKIVYLLQGHGEVRLEDETEKGLRLLSHAIEGENLRMRELSLLKRQSVPEDAAAVVLINAQGDYLPEEVIALQEFVAAGGALLIFAEFDSPEPLRRLARIYGIDVKKAIIVEPVIRLQGVAVETNLVLSTYVEHPIIKDLGENDKRVTFRLAAPVDVARVKPAEGAASQLLLTSKEAWGETNLDRLFSDQPQAAKEPADISGPVSVAAVYEGKGRVVVFGDSDFIRNDRMKYLFNRDLVLNALNWALGDTTKISLRARTLEGSREMLSTEQFSSIFSVAAILIPELIVILGLFVWWKRRAASE